MNYYLDLFTPETWDAFRQHGAKVSGFRERQRKTAERVRPGDKLLCYVVRLSRWCGVLDVKSQLFIESSPIFSDPDPFLIRFYVEPIVALDLEKSIPILEQEVWSRLSLTKGIERGVPGWAQRANLRASLRQMNSADGAFLSDLLLKQQSVQRLYTFSAQDKQRIGAKASIRTVDRAVLVEGPTSEIDLPAQDNEPTHEIRASIQLQATVARIGAEMGFRIWVPKSDKQKVLDEIPPDLHSLFIEALPLNYDVT